MKLSRSMIKSLNVLVIISLMDILVIQYADGMWPMFVSALLFLLCFMLVEKRYHLYVYLFYIPVMIKYWLFFPVVIVIIALVLNSKLKYASKAILLLFVSIFIPISILAYNARGIVQVRILTENLQSNEELEFCLRNPHLISWLSVSIYEQNQSNNTYNLIVKYSSNGDTYNIDISEYDRRDDRIYFGNIMEYLKRREKNQIYRLQVISDTVIPPKTSVRLTATMSYGDVIFRKCGIILPSSYGIKNYLLDW